MEKEKDKGKDVIWRGEKGEGKMSVRTARGKPGSIPVDGTYLCASSTVHDPSMLLQLVFGFFSDLGPVNLTSGRPGWLNEPIFL